MVDQEQLLDEVDDHALGQKILIEELGDQLYKLETLSKDMRFEIELVFFHDPQSMNDFLGVMKDISLEKSASAQMKAIRVVKVFILGLCRTLIYEPLKVACINFSWFGEGDREMKDARDDIS